MKYRASRDLPKFAREYHTLSPTKLCAIILKERNKQITPDAITHWFKRHPEIHAQLKHEILQEQLPEMEISESIFENNNFKELRSVKNWKIQMDARELTARTMSRRFGCLRNFCLGKAYGVNFVDEGKWCLKHPDRIITKDVMEFISLVRDLGKDTYYIKTNMKDFLESKGEIVGKKFAIGKPKGYGKFKELFVKKKPLREMLNWIQPQNFEAYVVDEFMYVNGTRITATLKALIENLHVVEDVATIQVFDKGRKIKYPDGHPWWKQVTTHLLYDMQQLIGDREYGRIFNITADEMAGLNREAIIKFCPEILKKYPTVMPNHFWRHMFFQHILRQCNWNYTIAAALGGSTPQSVEESYGKPPEEEIKKWRGQYSIDI